MNTLRFALAALLVTLPALARAGDDAGPLSRHLVGTIGALPIRLELQRDGAKLSGSYVYERAKPALQTVVDVLFLEGAVDAQGRVTLAETVDEKTTGRITGTLVDGDAGLRLTGTWTKPDGSGGLPIAAGEVRSTPGGLRIVDRRVEERAPRFAKIVEARYPRFDGSSDPNVAKLNGLLEQKVARIVKDFESSVGELVQPGGEAEEQLALDVGYEVTLATDALVSVRFEVYNDFGGAHPSSFVEAVTYDLRAGRTLAIDDLFRKGSKPLTVLAAKARPLFRGDFEGAADTTPKPENYSIWYLTARGLTIVYEVPHVMGDTAEVSLPFAELAAVLDPTRDLR